MVSTTWSRRFITFASLSWTSTTRRTISEVLSFIFFLMDKIPFTKHPRGSENPWILDQSPFAGSRDWYPSPAEISKQAFFTSGTYSFLSFSRLNLTEGADMERAPTTLRV